MNKKNQIETIFAIAERADNMGILDFDRITCKMDIERWLKIHDIDLNKFLHADNLTFQIEIYQIQLAINRLDNTIDPVYTSVIE